MDQFQQDLCDMQAKMPACLTDRNILRAALADYLPNNKLQQNLLLNAFDSDVIQSIQSGHDTTLAALNCISQLERDYGMTKDLAFWSIQTWCYIIGNDSTAMALDILRPSNQPSRQIQNNNTPNGNTFKIGLGIYRAGIDFPAGELSIQANMKPKYDIYYKVSKTPKTNSNDGYFKDKIYVHMLEGYYLILHTIGSEDIEFTVNLIKGY